MKGRNGKKTERGRKKKKLTGGFGLQLGFQFERGVCRANAAERCTTRKQNATEVFSFLLINLNLVKLQQF